jgi:hypothetical protein
VLELSLFTKLKKPNTIEGMRSVSQFSVPSFHVVGLFSWRLQIPCIHGWEFSEKNPALSLRLTKTLTLSDHDTPITPRQRGRVSRGFFFRDCVRAGPSVSVEAGCNLRRRGATYVKPKTVTAPTGLRVPVRGEKRVRKHSICRHRTRKKRLWKPLDRTTTIHTASARKSNRYTLL